MNIPNNSHLNINNLPNEILLMIINKLNISDIVYSFIDINERFAELIINYLCIRNLDMTIMKMKSFYDRTFSIDDKILSRICDQILCRISDQINALTVEQHSIQRILHPTDYPQLYSLSLVNFDGKTLDQYLTGIVF